MQLGTVRFRHGGLGIHDAAYSPDGKILATAGESGKIHLWEAATGKQIALLEGEKNTMLLSLAFSPDGKTLASGGRGFDWRCVTSPDSPRSRRFGMWPSARPLSILNDHDDAGNLHVFRGTPPFLRMVNGWPLLTTSGSASGRLLRRRSAADQLELSSVIALAFSPDGHTLAWSGPDNGDLVMWDVATREEVAD